MAPDESALGNATVLAGVLPSVDAIIQTLQYNATDEIITFSASMDPGASHMSRATRKQGTLPMADGPDHSRAALDVDFPGHIRSQRSQLTL